MLKTFFEVFYHHIDQTTKSAVFLDKSYEEVLNKCKRELLLEALFDKSSIWWLCSGIVSSQVKKLKVFMASWMKEQLNGCVSLLVVEG